MGIYHLSIGKMLLEIDFTVSSHVFSSLGQQVQLHR